MGQLMIIVQGTLLNSPHGINCKYGHSIKIQAVQAFWRGRVRSNSDVIRLCVWLYYDAITDSTLSVTFFIALRTINPLAYLLCRKINEYIFDVFMLTCTTRLAMAVGMTCLWHIYNYIMSLKISFCFRFISTCERRITILTWLMRSLSGS